MSNLDLYEQNKYWVNIPWGAVPTAVTVATTAGTVYKASDVYFGIGEHKPVPKTQEEIDLEEIDIIFNLGKE